jgi:hypothetical protein
MFNVTDGIVSHWSYRRFLFFTCYALTGLLSLQCTLEGNLHHTWVPIMELTPQVCTFHIFYVAFISYLYSHTVRTSIEWFGTPGLLNLPGDFQGTDYMVNFINNLDPNVFTKPSSASLSSTIFWPQYALSNRTLLTFQDGLIPLTLTEDNFREEPIGYLGELARTFPW